MIEKKISSKTNKLKNFLVTGTVDRGDGSEYDKEEYQEEYEAEGHAREDEVLFEADAAATEDVAEAPVKEEHPARIPSASPPPSLLQTPPAEPGPGFNNYDKQDIEGYEQERFSELEAKIDALTADLGKYTTTKEQLKEYSAAVSKRDAELANRKFIGMLEQLSAVREDFFKLCTGINSKLDSFSAKDVLSSFEAFEVDLENILIDSGVEIGPSKFERLNTIHQRIVDVIPTDEEGKNGMIAERVSDGYVYRERVLLKEKVKIYRYSEKEKTEGDEEDEQ